MKHSSIRNVVLGVVLWAAVGCESTPPNPDAETGDVVSAEPVAIPARLTLSGMETSQAPTALASLTGGDLGIGGGFLIGASREKIEGKQRQAALEAAQKGEQLPAQLGLVRGTTTADLNADGFVTLDEILAMVRAGLNDGEAVDRLRKTGYVFNMTPEQERYLTDRGVSTEIVSTLQDLSNHSAVASQLH